MLPEPSCNHWETSKNSANISCTVQLWRKVRSAPPPFINTIIWGDSPVALPKLKWEERAIKQTPEGEFLRYSLKFTFFEDFVCSVLYHSRHPDLPSTLSSCYYILLRDLSKKSTLITQEQPSMMSNHTLSSEASVSWKRGNVRVCNVTNWKLSSAEFF